MGREYPLIWVVVMSCVSLFEVDMIILKHVWRNWKKTWMFWGPLVWFACLAVNPPVTIMLSYVAICIVIVVMGVKGMMKAIYEDE